MLEKQTTHNSGAGQDKKTKQKKTKTKQTNKKVNIWQG